ncbi:hypothetical protein D1872_273510 [compost metagenome]
MLHPLGSACVMKGNFAFGDQQVRSRALNVYLAAARKRPQPPHAFFFRIPMVFLSRCFVSCTHRSFSSSWYGPALLILRTCSSGQA